MVSRACAIYLAIWLVVMPQCVTFADDLDPSFLTGSLSQQGKTTRAVKMETNACGDQSPSVEAFDPCQDLFQASCMNSDGTFKDAGMLQGVMSRKIDAARD